MSLTQIATDTPGRAYYRRKRATRKSHQEALRCLKRRISDTVHRRMLQDQQASPGGQTVATTDSSAAASTRTDHLFGRVTSRARGTEATTTEQCLA